MKAHETITLRHRLSSIDEQIIATINCLDYTWVLTQVTPSSTLNWAGKINSTHERTHVDVIRRTNFLKEAAARRDLLMSYLCCQLGLNNYVESIHQNQSKEVLNG